MEQENKREKISFQWQPMIELIIVLMTILGSTIPLYMHTDNKLETALQGMRQDMQDFHTQLTKQDADFKSFLKYKFREDEGKK
jgi:hypothetical protein